MRNHLFGELLTEGLKQIHARTGKKMGYIEQDIGDLLGVSQKTVQRWRGGDLPPDPEDRATLARWLVEEGGMSQQWLSSFLHQARYHSPEQIVEALFPAGAVGTTPLIPLQSAYGATCQPDEDYFILTVEKTQLAYVGEAWRDVRQFMICGQVGWHGGESAKTLPQHSEIAQWGQVVWVGYRPVLVDCQPVRPDTLHCTVDLLTHNQQKRVLHFVADFPFLTRGVGTGRYLLLGSCDPAYPLPSQAEWQQFRQAQTPAPTHYTALYLRLQTLSARTRHKGIGTPWYGMLQEAENLAEDVANQLLGEPVGWSACLRLLQDARQLLQADRNYHAWEAREIYLDVASACRDLIRGEADPTRQMGTFAGQSSTPQLLADLADLGIDPGLDIQASLKAYRQKEAISRRVLRQAGLMPVVEETP